MGSVQTAYVFPRFYGSDLSCFNVHGPTCPRDMIICLPDGLLLIFLILLLRTSICVFNSHIFSDFLDSLCLWYSKTLILLAIRTIASLLSPLSRGTIHLQLSS